MDVELLHIQFLIQNIYDLQMKRRGKWRGEEAEACQPGLGSAEGAKAPLQSKRGPNLGRQEIVRKG